jgi:hypothetical protein
MLSPSSRVVASKTQLSTTLAGEVVILGMHDAVYYGLEGAGAHIWALIQEPRTLDELAGIVAADYDVDRSRALADLITLADRLADRGLLDVVPPAAR